MIHPERPIALYILNVYFRLEEANYSDTLHENSILKYTAERLLSRTIKGTTAIVRQPIVGNSRLLLCEIRVGGC